MSREAVLLVDDIVSAFRDICAWMEPVDPARFHQLLAELPRERFGPEG